MQNKICVPAKTGMVHNICAVFFLFKIFIPSIFEEAFDKDSYMRMTKIILEIEHTQADLSLRSVQMFSLDILSFPSTDWLREPVEIQLFYFHGELNLVLKNLVMIHANNKGADQPAHPCSLISAFVIRCLDSIIPEVSLSENSRPLVSPTAEQLVEYGLEENPGDRFSHHWTQSWNSLIDIQDLQGFEVCVFL